VKPILGRLIKAEDDKAGARPVVLLTETFWTREFDRDPRVLGMQLDLNGEAYSVIGVVPSRGFRLLWSEDVDICTSLGRITSAAGDRRSDHNGIYAYARLKPGVSVEAARAEMVRIAADLAKRYPQTNSGQGAFVMPFLREKTEDVQQPLVLLMGAVGLVLLIACANVANCPSHSPVPMD
jgi:putative ABC transport system permease protein